MYFLTSLHHVSSFSSCFLLSRLFQNASRMIPYLDPKWNIVNSNWNRSLTSITKRLEEKRIARLTLLRNAVVDIFENNFRKADPFDWHDCRRELIRREIHFPSHFEFALLSAFDLNLFSKVEQEGGQDQIKPASLSPELFEEIVKFVQESDAIRSNKIASVRFSLFLSQYPEYLNQNHLDFIRKTALSLSSGQSGVLIQPVFVDIFRSLTKSSKENCRLALELLPKILEHQDLKSLNFKLNLFDIIFNAMIDYGLIKECHQFLKSNASLLEVNHRLIGKVLLMFSGSSTTENYLSKEDYVQLLSSLSEFQTPILLSDASLLTENILKNKLGYTSVTDVRIDPFTSKCMCCGNRLPGLTMEEFLQLKHNFRSIIFDEHDKYVMDNLKEHHLELMDFESKISIPVDDFNAEPKYNIVIDGLNVSYRRSKEFVEDKIGPRTYTKIFKTKHLDQQIVNLIERNRLMDRYNNILLIGRKHMKTWFKLNRLCRGNPNIHLNLLFDQTRDDNFILYAAVQHPKTMILSCDYFRDHRTKFKDWYVNRHLQQQHKDNGDQRPNLGRIFHRWLKSRQIKIESTNSTLLKYPFEYDIKIHLHSNIDSNYPTIHIPVINVEDPYDEDHQIQWICARP